LQIHWPDRYVPLFGAPPYDASLERESIPFEDQLRAFEELIKAGKVRYIGVSNETPYGLMKFTEAADRLQLPRIVSVQNSYSLVTRSDTENGLTEVLSNEAVSLLVYSPLAGGILTGKYRANDCPKSARLNLFEGYMARYKQSLCTEAVDKYCALADTLGLTPAELSLAWCYSRPYVTSTIIGATQLAQLQENIEAYSKRHLITADVLKAIDDIYKRYRDPSKI
jgi:aryl-alcohol dehydrogenase-like predicted oxidoreductase